MDSILPAPFTIGVRVGQWLKLLALSFLLALLVTLCGCSQMPPGLEFSIGLEGSPPGIVLGIKTPPQYVLSRTSDGFAIGAPATAPGITAGNAGAITGDPGPATLPAPGQTPKP